MAASVPNMSGNKIVPCEPYIRYDPLPEGYVRLLKIQDNLEASNIEEEIEISLIPVSLAKCPPYITLSYTWADPEPFVDPTAVIFTKVPRCFPVKCGGRLILVTRNLRNALRRLRQYKNIQNSAPAHSTQGKMAAELAKYNKNIHLYWIDAICIDQEDLYERSTQVSLMSKIYQQAQCTMAWLGEEDAYTVPAVQVLLKIVGDQIAKNSFVCIGDSTTTQPRFEGIDTLDDAEIEALAMLMMRKWGSRTWILQEVVLSPSVLTLWGGVFFSFEVLIRVGSHLSISRSSLRLGGHLERILANHRSERGTFERILAQSTTLGMIHNSRLELQHNLKKPSFVDAVSMSRSSEATDPRDKIYGILGIAAEFELSGQVSHKPDYGLTVAEVYIMATAFVIRSRHNLACLTLVCDSSVKKVKDLPSWCPDYSASVPPLREHCDITRTWRLGLSWPDALIPEILGTSMLRVDGSLFDVVAETSTLLKDSSNHRTNHGLSAVFELATLLEDRNASTCSTRQIRAPFETLWRTLILDEFDYKAPAPATTAFLVPAFIAFLLCTIYTLKSTESDKLSIGSYTRTLEVKESVLKELQRLELMVNQLKGDRHTASPGIPNIDRMRMCIEQYTLQGISDGNYGQRVIDSLRFASAQEICHFCQAQEHGSSSADLPHVTELFQRHFVGNLGDGRLKRVYFRTGNTLGTGYPSVRSGDEIWFLYGASAPIILRRLATGDYRFMGEAYVHGVMYGEAGAEIRRHELITIE